MLLVFLYHQALKGKHGNSIEILDKHFQHLSKNYSITLPGDPLKGFCTNVCLTFDDAHIDFYTKVYPLLKKHRLKALLAVPVSLIGDPSYCSWDILKELAKSGIIHIASHSMSHSNLLDPNVDIDYELTQSKKVLEDSLDLSVDTFVYPYGKFNQKIHQEAKKHYKYIMRIGSAINRSWQNSHQLIYRIPSDNLSHPLEKLTYFKKSLYFLNFMKNTLRGK